MLAATLSFTGGVVVEAYRPPLCSGLRYGCNRPVLRTGARAPRNGGRPRDAFQRGSDDPAGAADTVTAATRPPYAERTSPRHATAALRRGRPPRGCVPPHCRARG